MSELQGAVVCAQINKLKKIITIQRNNYKKILTVLSSIIMFDFKREKSIVFHVILGIFMSVMIYYLNFLFSSLGNTGKIPIIYSIFMPLLFISLIATIGLIRVNEK